MRKSIRLALLNIKNDRKHAKTFSSILCICITIILVTVSISKGFVKICNSYKTEEPSLREVEMWSEEGEMFNSETMKKISYLPHVSDSSQNYNIQFNQNYKVSIVGTDLECLPLLEGRNRYFSFAPMSTVLANNKMKYVDPIIFGRNFNSKDEKKAIIDEDTCYILGYTNPQDIISKKVTIKFSDITISDVEIVGVCSYMYGYYYSDLKGIDGVSKKGYLESPLCNPLFFTDDIIQNVIKSEDTVEWSYENLRVFVDNTDNIRNVCEKAMELYGYSSFNMVSSIETKAESVRNICVFLYIIAAVILLIVFISITNSLIIKIERQKKFAEMILKIGYKKKDIRMVYLIEHLLITIKSGLIALCISILSSIGIDMFLVNGYSQTSSHAKFAFLLNIPMAIVMVVTITALVSLLTYIVAFIQICKLGKKMVHR